MRVQKHMSRFAPNGKATAKNSPVGLINVAESTEYLTEAYITSEHGSVVLLLISSPHVQW